MADCPQNARSIRVVRCAPPNGPALDNSGPGGIHYGSYHHYIQSALLSPSDPLYQDHENIYFCVTIDGQTPNQSHVGKWVERNDIWWENVFGDPSQGYYLSSNHPMGVRFRIEEIIPWSGTSCNLPGLNCNAWGTTNSQPTPNNYILLPTIVDSCNNQAYTCVSPLNCEFEGNYNGIHSGDLYHSQNYNPYPFTQSLYPPSLYPCLQTGQTFGSCNYYGSSSCWTVPNVCNGWDCKTDKFGNSGCVQSSNGTGVYTSLQDCQNNCLDAVRIDPPHFDDGRTATVTPWIDEEFGGCKTDIWTCPCGWDYIENYQGYFTQFAGMRMCTSPNHGVYQTWSMHNPQSAAPNHYSISGAVYLSCVEQQGLFHPIVGMSVKPHLQSPNPQAFGSGNYQYWIDNTLYTDTWDNHVIVDVDHAYNTSLMAYIPWIQPASPC